MLVLYGVPLLPPLSVPLISCLAAQFDLLHCVLRKHLICGVFFFSSRLEITCLDGATVLETIGKIGVAIISIICSI